MGRLCSSDQRRDGGRYSLRLAEAQVGGGKLAVCAASSAPLQCQGGTMSGNKMKAANSPFANPNIPRIPAYHAEPRETSPCGRDGGRGKCTTQADRRGALPLPGGTAGIQSTLERMVDASNCKDRLLMPLPEGMKGGACPSGASGPCGCNPSSTKWSIGGPEFVSSTCCKKARSGPPAGRKIPMRGRNWVGGGQLHRPAMPLTSPCGAY